MTTAKNSPPMTRREISRAGCRARLEKTSPEERARDARLGGMATARRSADARAARAAEIRAAAVEAVALIRDAVARGERVPFFDFVDGRAVPENRMRKAFAELTGGTWTAAHRKEARAVWG